MTPGDRVVVQLTDFSQGLEVFWACILGGFITVPTPVPSSYEQPSAKLQILRHAATSLDAQVVITDRKHQQSLSSLLSGTTQVWGVEEMLTRRPTTVDDIYFAAPEDLALLMLTSGSSGLPKAVMLSHQNIMASIRSKIAGLNLEVGSVTLNWVAIDHVAGILDFHLLPMMLYGNQIHVDAELLIANPTRFLSLCSEHQVNLAFTPNFFIDILANYPSWATEADNLNLSSLQVLISGGEALVRTTAARFLERGADYGLRRGVLHPAFGMTETCAGCVFNPNFDGYGDEAFASLGKATPGFKMRIVDENGVELPDGEVGELQLSGAMVTSGYYKNSEANVKSFTTDGWFRTGDLASIDGGSLRLSGRSKDSIIVNGINYFSHELEAVLSELAGLEPSYIAVTPTRASGDATEQVAIFFTPYEDGLESLSDAALVRLCQAIRDQTILHWGMRPAVIVPLPKAQMEKSSLGKLSRSKLRRTFENGAFAFELARVQAAELTVIGEYRPPANEIENQILALYAETLGMEPEAISTDRSFFELGGTSLDTVQIHSRLIDYCGFSFPLVRLMQHPSVYEIADYIKACQACQFKQGGGALYTPIVPMQNSGGGAPLFCVHPGVGEVLIFVNWAKHFTNIRPFYALRARGFEPGESYFSSMEEMVDIYTQSIIATQPEGPCSIAGYSYGGIVAYEIAKSLETQGRQVEFCGLINIPPHIKPRMLEIGFTDGLLNLSMFLDLVNKAEISSLMKLLADRPESEQIHYIITQAPHNRLQELNMDAEKLRLWVELAASLIDCGRRYEPRGEYGGNLSVFYADPLRGAKADWLDTLQDWRNYVSGEIRYIEVPGAHYTLMSPKHLPTFAQIFHAAMNNS